jgi:serine/threonine protein phosphatase PrpC
VQVQVACMSRAGCEPGYKKTNQDNCFAFEKYITEDQALFGAMDGHGPNGETAVCTECAYVLGTLVNVCWTMSLPHPAHDAGG